MAVARLTAAVEAGEIVEVRAKAERKTLKAVERSFRLVEVDAADSESLVPQLQVTGRLVVVRLYCRSLAGSLATVGSVLVAVAAIAWKIAKEVALEGGKGFGPEAARDPAYRHLEVAVTPLESSHPRWSSVLPQDLA
jgi:hypothetical protein